MALLPELRLSEEEKLRTLQRLDQFRTWHSLDDKRYCLGCRKIVNGWTLKIVGGSRGLGPLRIVCATENCESIPMDWVLPTDEILSSILARDGDDVVAPGTEVPI
jgi:hypothetical protein